MTRPGYRQARPVKVLVWPQPDTAAQKEVDLLPDSERHEELAATSVREGDRSPDTAPQLTARCPSATVPAKEAETSLAGALLVAYEDVETCLFILRWPEVLARVDCFVTFRIGPVGTDGYVVHSQSFKLAGNWPAGSDLEWVLRGLPLAKLAAKSPLGLVACRFKIWVQGWVSRRWLGRSAPVGVPSPAQAVQIGRTRLAGEVRRGPAAEVALQNAKAPVLDVRDGPPADGKETSDNLKVVALPDFFLAREAVPDSISTEQEAAVLSASYAEALGSAVLEAVAARRWGVAKVLLQELQRAPEATRKRALAKADVTCKTALRMCVDALAKERPHLLQALEGSTFRIILGKTRQYWWYLHIKTVCINTFWFNGQIVIGVPRSRGFQASSDLLTRTPLASWTDPPWAACIWSKPQECDGKLEVDTASGFPQAEGRAQLSIAGGHDVQLTLRLVPPGEAAPFGHTQLRNPLSHALVAASGIIAGKIASGACDPAACARLAAEMEEGGPRVAAQLILDLGADPRALADDGLSPYTAAILKEDPCGMLSGLDSGLRLRILKGDKTAWAEVARSAQGRGPPDIAAGALSRGLAIPESMAEELLGYCFEADLPLLTLRVLARIDGKRFLMPALQRAGSQAWQRVAERIVQQTRPGLKPYWLSSESLRYAVLQIQTGRSQYRLLLDAFMDYLRASEAEEFLSDPCALPQTRGGAECPICLEPLCRSTPTAFVDAADIAVCLHLLCSSCARGYASSTNSQGEALRCPECRRHAVTMKQLPSLSEDPLHWFEFLAGASDTVSVNGKVAKSMLLRTISSMLPVEADAIEAGGMGGKELSPEVSASDFLTHELFVWVWRQVQEHLRCMKLGPPPDLEERRAWFKHWNLTESGRLSRAEVLRALLRSFWVSSTDRDKLQEMQSRVERVWDLWCTNQLAVQGHADPNSVTCEEFAAGGGFGDLLDETFGLDPGGHGLHPAPPNEASSVPRRHLGQRQKPEGAGLSRGWHPTNRGGRTGSAPSGRLVQLQPRSKAFATPPPDLEVPSETVAPPGLLASPFHVVRIFDPFSPGVDTSPSSSPSSSVRSSLTSSSQGSREDGLSEDAEEPSPSDRSPGLMAAAEEAFEILHELSLRDTVVSL